ncbi:MAG: FKBP-type peptidyl-prolyl cis-trans isomerase [Deltaproteobacteria bacterium]|nr:FKBP-type peptidyl-prolyl cis-trans isomerase [Deltaproteobacteria bacterium]MBW2512622.1 FKBP-type peptidyl-prolyl cis-trans isomerase [Deltaproteobacteria bacterium]
MIMLTYLAGCAPEEASSASELKLDTSKNRISYTIGVNIGQDFKSQNMDVDPDLLLMGLKDTLSGKELQLTEEEMVQEIQNFQQEMQVKMAAEMEAKAAENKAAGEAFLAENAKQEGVVVTESGLQYKIIEPGQGDSPGPADVATVHYRGTLIDGTQFDSSYDRGQPASFPVGGVIPGWSEALQLMKPGAKWQLSIPAELAYGERGAGQDIGPNSTLLFDVELISVEQGAN